MPAHRNRQTTEIDTPLLEFALLPCSPFRLETVLTSALPLKADKHRNQRGTSAAHLSTGPMLKGEKSSASREVPDPDIFELHVARATRVELQSNLALRSARLRVSEVDHLHAI